MSSNVENRDGEPDRVRLGAAGGLRFRFEHHAGRVVAVAFDVALGSDRLLSGRATVGGEVDR